MAKTSLKKCFMHLHEGQNQPEKYFAFKRKGQNRSDL
jgi:hypothetical protein